MARTSQITHATSKQQEEKGESDIVSNCVQEEYVPPQEIEESHPVVVSMTMIASTLLLRIPIVEDDDDDDDEPEKGVTANDAVISKVNSKSSVSNQHCRTNENYGNQTIAKQLSAWLDQYQLQRQSTAAAVVDGEEFPQRPSSQGQPRHDSTAQDVSSSTTGSSGNSNHHVLNNSNSDSNLIHMTSTECYDDFLYLHQCRQNIQVILQHISNHYRTYQTIQNLSYPENIPNNRENTSSSSSSRSSSGSRSRRKAEYDPNYVSKQQQQHNTIPFIEYALEELKHYLAVLQEFINQGFPANEKDGLGFLSFTWYCPIIYEEDQKEDEENDNEHSATTNTRFYETHCSLSWECVNVLYNIAVLHTYRSSAALENHDSNRRAVMVAATAIPTRAQWTKAGQYLQNAATIVRYIRQSYYVVSTAAPTTIHSTHGELGLTSLSNHTNSNHSNKTTSTAAHSGITWYNSVLLCTPKFLEVLQLHLLAEAQRAAYQTFVATNLQATTTPSNQVINKINDATPSSALSMTATTGISTSPPKHFVLAKLAAAAAPLYLAVEDLCQGNNNQYDNNSDPSDEYDNDDDEKDIIRNTSYTDNRLAIESEYRSVQELSQMHEQSTGSSQSGPPTATSMTPTLPPQILQWSTTRFIQEWEDSVRAYGMWMTTLAEYHQSWVHRKRNSSTSSSGTGNRNNHATTEHGLEIARLEGALKFADYCRDFCESTNVRTVQLLLPQIKQLVKEMEERFDKAKRENELYIHDTIPEHDELPEISQVLSVKTDLENISKLLPSLNPERVTLFANVLDPKLRIYVDMFRMKVQKVIVQTEQLANRQTEMAREQLAAVNLPHSITTYRQQQNGGGLPDEIWNRILPLQELNTVEQFSREVWSIRKLSDTANDMLQQIHAQLVDILEIDTVFRQTNRQFVGHDVQQIQKIFRPILQTYDQVLSSARTSDDLLMNRCDVFDTDPKFRLLKMPKSQLDRLFPPIRSTDNNCDDDDFDMYDTNILRDLLVELSKLFNHRDTILHSLHEHSKTYDISKELLNRGLNTHDVSYQQIVDMALTSLQPLVNEIRINLEKQGKLLYKISSENEQFMNMRDHQAQLRVASKVSMQGGPIVKIYDALEEVESFKQHIQQGKEFYDIVIPKLQKLHEQVNDVSGRLATERMEYEKLPRRTQRLSHTHTRENEIGESPSRYNRRSSRFETCNVDGYNDEKEAYNHREVFGQQSSRTNFSATVQQDTMDRISRPPSTTYRPENQSGIEVYVDDEKVASLVSMDFDPAKAVAALQRHNNDLELALNELLAG